MKFYVRIIQFVIFGIIQVYFKLHKLLFQNFALEQQLCFGKFKKFSSKIQNEFLRWLNEYIIIIFVTIKDIVIISSMGSATGRAGGHSPPLILKHNFIMCLPPPP